MHRLKEFQKTNTCEVQQSANLSSFSHVSHIQKGCYLYIALKLQNFFFQKIQTFTVFKLHIILPDFTDVSFIKENKIFLLYLLYNS